jgi:hypothetical protein
MKKQNATKTVTIEIIEDIQKNRRGPGTDQYGRPFLAYYDIGERKRVQSSDFDRYGNVWLNCGMCSSPIYANLFKIVRGQPLPAGERFDMGNWPKELLKFSATPLITKTN